MHVDRPAEAPDLASGGAGQRRVALDRPDFVGRTAELASLHNGLEAARAGHGRLVIVSGEAGIGKTRLADTFADLARDASARVVWGRCWEAGGAPAYWPCEFLKKRRHPPALPRVGGTCFFPSQAHRTSPIVPGWAQTLRYH
jgi:predicted ATPase